MRVYDHKGLPNPLRVRLALAEKGLTDQVEFVHVDVVKGEHRAPAFLELNPSGTVPVLELDDGTVIAECTAITEYLEASNETAKPFVWTKSADEILASVARFCTRTLAERTS